MSKKYLISLVLAGILTAGGFAGASRSMLTVNGWDDTQKQEMETRALAQIKNDPALKNVVIAKDSINLDYATTAKLFGFIPFPMTVHVVSDNNGRVVVTFPWYRFLVKTNHAHSAELMNGVFQHNQSNLEFLKAKSSAEAQLEIFLNISGAMHEMAKPIIQNIKA